MLSAEKAPLFARQKKSAALASSLQLLTPFSLSPLSLPRYHQPAITGPPNGPPGLFRPIFPLLLRGLHYPLALDQHSSLLLARPAARPLATMARQGRGRDAAATGPPHAAAATSR